MLLIFLSHHRWECCVNFPVRQVRKCDDVPSDWLAVMGSGYGANWHPDREYRETWWNLARVLHFSAYDIIRQFKHVLTGVLRSIINQFYHLVFKITRFWHIWGSITSISAGSMLRRLLNTTMLFCAFCTSQAGLLNETRTHLLPAVIDPVSKGSRRLSNYLGTRTRRFVYLCRDVWAVEYLDM
jgi:hypothetical protein